jgi:peptide/nickel transport system permease protein
MVLSLFKGLPHRKRHVNLSETIMHLFENHPMLKYTVKRVLEMVPTSLGIIVLTFLLFNVIGSSPAEVILGQNATPEAIASFNHKWGYDLPLYERFFKFVADVFTGNFGFSIEMNEPVIDILKRSIGPSLSLTVPILLGSVVISLMMAMICAHNRAGYLDKAMLFISTFMMSVNYVVWVILGQYFLSYKMEIFPIWGYQNIFYLALPVAIGIFTSVGPDLRFFRTAILDEIYKPYVLTAKSKNLSAFTIMTRHVLRNALIPIVTYVSLSIPYLFSGSLLLESFFGIPGLGATAINAIHSSDMAVVRAVVVIGAFAYQFINLAVDLLSAVLDPRIRLK